MKVKANPRPVEASNWSHRAGLAHQIWKEWQWCAPVPTTLTPPAAGWVVLQYTETTRSYCWLICDHWLHLKLSFWQLKVQPLMTKSSAWQPFCFSVCHWNNNVVQLITLPSMEAMTAVSSYQHCVNWRSEANKYQNSFRQCRSILTACNTLSDDKAVNHQRNLFISVLNVANATGHWFPGNFKCIKVPQQSTQGNDRMLTHYRIILISGTWPNIKLISSSEGKFWSCVCMGLTHGRVKMLPNHQKYFHCRDYILLESGIIYLKKITVHVIDKRRHSVFIVHIDVGCWKSVCLDKTHINAVVI